MKVSEIREIMKFARATDLISLGGGYPDPSCLPNKKEIESTVEYITNEVGSKAFQYGLTAGVPELREELSKYCSKELGTKILADEILITTGSQQALDITGRILINENDLIFMELPTYIAAIQSFNLYNPNYIGLQMDDEGLKTDFLENELTKLKAKNVRPKFLYTIPTCQNPAGLSMSMNRRKHLLELASKYDFLIIEDDPYSQIVFKSLDFKRLKSMDTEGRVIYTSTFSKIYAPGVRVGWIIADKDILDSYELAKQSIDLCTSNLAQYFVFYALQSGMIERRLPTIIQKYKKKCELMLEALSQYMPNDARWSNPVGGMFVFVWLNERINTRKMLYDVIQKYGVAYVPGSSFYVNETGWNTMRLNFSYPTEEKIVEGVKRLTQAIKEEQSKLQ